MEFKVGDRVRINANSQYLLYEGPLTLGGEGTVEGLSQHPLFPLDVRYDQRPEHLFLTGLAEVDKIEEEG